MSRNYDLLQAINHKVETLPAAAKSAKLYRHGTSPYRRSPNELERPAWTRLLFILQKHWRLSALFAGGVFFGVVLATLLTRPLYEPTVTVEIDPPGTQTFSLERSQGEGLDYAQYLETQAKKLESDELALDVIRKLGLDHDPDFADMSRRNARQTEEVHTEAAVQLNSREDAALKTFRTRLKVQRDTGSRLVTVRFASHDAHMAAQVANTLVNEFVHNNFAFRHEAIMETTAWLSRQLDDIRGKMDQANRALLAFQNETGIADLDTNRSTVAEQMAELNRQYALAESDRIQFEALLAKARNASPESLPQAGDNPVVQQLTQKLAETRGELSQAQVEYGKNHPVLKKLQSEVDQLQTELSLQKGHILDRLETSYAAAQSRERLLEQQRKLTAKQLNEVAQYNALKKEAQSETELYNSLYARVKEAGIAAASDSYNVRIIDHAQVLRSPSQPRIMLNVCFGLLAAIFGGVIIACGREALDNRIHTPEDIRDLTGIASVTVLPLVPEDDSIRPALPAAFGPTLKSARNTGQCVPTFLLERPNSAAAEALRGLYTAVMHSWEGGFPQVLLVTSALTGEGRTTIASNLAIALARRGPTCLVDGDLRRTGVSRTFGLQGHKGFADLLSGSAALDQVITELPDVLNLSIVPSGSPDKNPGELIADESSSRVVTALRERFHFVVFDSPPILPYADGRMLSTLADGLIVVVRYCTTTRPAIARSLEVLSEIHAAPVLEVVLNGGDSIVSAQ